MNVFENLLEELEDEHLLEKPIADDSNQKSESKKTNAEVLDLSDIDGLNPAENQRINSNSPDNDELLETEAFLKKLEAEDQESKEKPAKSDGSAKKSSEFGLSAENFLDLNHSDQVQNESEADQKQKLTEFEFFRKRAMEEVSSLQMVDNIFSRVEREQMKIVPKPYDDLPVKKILHSFLQLPGNVSLTEHAQAEFELLQQTQSWYSALTERDNLISVENLRYCCETTRPPLSPPALIALARFYRNAPFSESVRNKFDLIITRLFSRDIEDNKRELVFSHEELTEHLTELYAEWESVNFYSSDEKDEELLMLVLKFEDFINEADRAQCFDDLIKTEFFNRVRALKRSASENFYAPQIAAISIICNVQVGNRYLDLLQKEQIKSFEETIDEKYGYIFDQSISDATNKSVQIAEILKERKENPQPFDLEKLKHREVSKHNNQKVKNKRTETSPKFGWLKNVNKGILALTVLSVLISGGLYLWVEVFTTAPKLPENVKQFNVENTEFKEFLMTARINNETFFAITTKVWDDLSKEKKEEIINKLFAKGKTNNYKKVHLLNEDGLTVGSATQNKIEVK